ncbi:PIG-L family deacetylase [Streptomyces pactum]|uniref:PIG-L family deacetylase n=1 Tax=Streptomyces pactum TaxID=68249 RepID=A8R0J2_9ACTN|nr:PIG-L family deacetylase [Streptomyces pactum]ACJ24865.1 putative nucleotydyltransferase [Streptomyces pactum]MBH5336231.1 PIG-L family deacetylase [Streptomyces pactum]BAF92591.1 putative deacetylase [Streptomyces pactum]
MTEIPDTWCPIALPHVETADGEILFMGRRITGSGRTAGEDAGLLARCDGARPLTAFPAADRAVLDGWLRDGVVVMAPAPARAAPGTAAAPEAPEPPRPAGTPETPEASGGPGATAAPGTPDPSGGPAIPGTPVIVSPHPDDAALAVGGTVAREGGRFLDVFSEETWTKDPYYAERPAQTRRLLLAEETVAARVLGAEVELLGFTDAADRELRRDRFFADKPWSDGFAREEPELFEAVTERLAPLLAGTAPVYAPLGVGGHVDHLACRDAVVALARTGRIDPGRLRFYEDQPYSLFSSAEETARRLGPWLELAGLGPLDPELRPVDGTAALAKREALKAYRIQVRRGIIHRIGRHDMHLASQSSQSGSPAAERLWRLRG